MTLLFDLLGGALLALVDMAIDLGTVDCDPMTRSEMRCRLITRPYCTEWYTDGQLIVWRQDFPGADLTLISNVIAPLIRR